LMDLYQCIRPVKYYAGVPSPVKHPEKLNVVIFRENTEDIYAGIEFREGTPEVAKLIAFVNDEMLKGTKKRVRLDSGVGIKPISITCSKRLVRAAIAYALKEGRKTVTLVHKGNIQKFTEGAFREWGYEVAVEEFRDETVTERESWILGNLEANAKLTAEENAALIEPGIEFAAKEFGEGVVAEVKAVLAAIGETHGAGKWKQKVLINDRIADSIFQQIILRPEDYSILATTNLNGDYISDAAAAQVGGLGSDAVRFSGMDGGGAADRVVDREDHCAEVCDVRFRAVTGGRDQGEDQRVCDADDREYGLRGQPLGKRNGFTRGTSKRSKSRVLRVATVRPLTLAIAAIIASSIKSFDCRAINLAASRADTPSSGSTTAPFANASAHRSISRAFSASCRRVTSAPA